MSYILDGWKYIIVVKDESSNTYLDSVTFDQPYCNFSTSSKIEILSRDEFHLLWRINAWFEFWVLKQLKVTNVGQFCFQKYLWLVSRLFNRFHLAMSHTLYKFIRNHNFQSEIEKIQNVTWFPGLRFWHGRFSEI